MKTPAWLRDVGPALIVAAVVLGPGSILTSSRVGATIGYPALGVLALAVVLMIGMVALAGRLGLAYERSLCEELAHRLGRPVSIGVGAVLYVLIALFQSSNNLSLIAGLEPLLGEAFNGFAGRAGVLIAVNAGVILCLNTLPDQYRLIENAMKLLIGVLVVAFLINFATVLCTSRPVDGPREESPADWVSLLGMVGTTFSVAAAFYQGYLVREKGWRLEDARKNLTDAAISISALGLITAVVLMTATLAFHGRPGVALNGVGDVARQLEPTFGRAAVIVFAVGILAGALSSFLVNAMIGGVVMADSLGLGSRMDARAPRLFTTSALLVGLGVGLARIADPNGAVGLIVFAQALTVLGMPALALALVYLGARPDLTGARRVPRWVFVIACCGLAVSCVVAVRMGIIVSEKLHG